MPRPPDLLVGGRRLRRQIELGERKGLLEMFDENTYFRGQPAASRSNCEDRHSSLERSQKTQNSTFSEFWCEKPRWRLGNTEMFKDTQRHLFDMTGSKSSCGCDTLRVWSGTKTPRQYRAPLDKGHSPKAVEIVWRFRCAVS